MMKYVYPSSNLVMTLPCLTRCLFTLYSFYCHC